MIWSRSRAAYSNSSIRLASFISFSSRAIVSARSRSESFFFDSFFFFTKVLSFFSSFHYEEKNSTNNKEVDHSAQEATVCNTVP